MRLSKIVGCLLAISLLAGCTAYSLVPATEKRDIGGVFRAEPVVAWSALKSGNAEHWTINGVGLEAISFITNVTDGKTIALGSGAKDDGPAYHDGMNATDVVNLYEAFLTGRGYSQVEVSGLRPHEISGAEAFQFDYTGFNTNGLGKRGTVVALIDEKKGLNLVIYEAAAEHYYDASRDTAEKVLASLEKI